MTPAPPAREKLAVARFSMVLGKSEIENSRREILADVRRVTGNNDSRGTTIGFCPLRNMTSNLGLTTRPTVLLFAGIVAVTALPLQSAAPMKQPTDGIERWPIAGRAGAARAVKADDQPLAFTSQIMAADVSRDARSQAEQMLDALGEKLAPAGGDLRRVLRLNLYVANDDVTAPVEAVLAARFGAAPPAVTLVRSPLVRAGALVACDAVAVVTRRSRAIERSGDVAIMPAGGKVFVSGQAKRGKDFAASVTQTMDALHASLVHVGLGKADVVQVKAFINPMTSHAAARAEIEKSYAGAPMPALVLSEWLANSPTEIELIASAPGLAAKGTEPAEFLSLPGMTTSPYFCRIATVAAGSSLIFVGGIDGGEVGAPREQWQRVFEKLAGVLQDTGSSFRHMIKATYFLADPGAREFLGEIRNVYYDPARPPAASAVDVQSIGVPKRAVGLDMIAVPTKRAPAPPAPGK